MDFGHDKGRINVQVDRLGSLPDDLIHKILSFIGIKHAVQTSSLSSRWRSIWTSIPYLNFSSDDFRTLPKFSKFVTHFLTHRNNQIQVSSVNLSFRGKVSQIFVKKIINYAFSHNVQEFTLSSSSPKQQTQLPLSLFSPQSLENLHLSLNNLFNTFSITPTSTLDLPALTTLCISSVTFYDDTTDNGLGLISKCANLKKLTLKYFATMGSNGLSICHPRLLDLTLQSGRWKGKGVNVVAPELERLTIIRCGGEHLISAPNLVSLVCQGDAPLKLCADGFCSLEKADLCFMCMHHTSGRDIVRLLRELHSAKFVVVNLEMVEFLSLFLELILHQPSPFANLKSLKIYPVLLEHQAHKNVY